MNDRLPRHRALYYGGRWHESKAQKSIPVIAPATGESIGSVVDASADDVDLAVTAAREAFRMWRDTPAQERAKAVRRAAQILLDNADDLAWLEALDTGNPFQAMRYDVEISAGYMEYFAGLVTEIKGDTIPIGPSTLNYTLREPLGVVGRIGAFNHPLLFTGRQVRRASRHRQHARRETGGPDAAVVAAHRRAVARRLSARRLQRGDRRA
jgi:betaine-aldehyde dehydrogenase